MRSVYEGVDVDIGLTAEADVRRRVSREAMAAAGASDAGGIHKILLHSIVDFNPIMRSVLMSAQHNAEMRISFPKISGYNVPDT
eukprot:2693553-Pleurochrysis_carterae.AAC.1